MDPAPDTTRRTETPGGEHTLHLVADDRSGIHPSDTLEIFWWLPILGPTATCAVAVIAQHVRKRPYTTSTKELAGQLGVRPSKLRATLDRIERFELGRWHSCDTFAIRTQTPPLPERHLDQLDPNYVARYHATHTTRPRRERHSATAHLDETTSRHTV